MVDSVESLRQKRLAALARNSASQPATTPTPSVPRPGNTPASSFPQPISRSTAPTRANTQSSGPGNIHTLSSLRSGSSTCTATSSRTTTVTETFSLWVGLPSKDITEDQLVNFVRVQFGVDIIVTFMNKKELPVGRKKDYNFCFIDCQNKDDMDRLIDVMHDSQIGDWEEPIKVKEKKDHP